MAMPANTKSSPAAPGSRLFVSPRVLDQGAFEAYAGELRNLIAIADTREAALQHVIAQAEAAQRATLDNLERHRAQLELIARMAKAMTARSEQVIGALDGLELLTSRVEALEAQAQGGAHRSPASAASDPGLAAQLEQGAAMRTEIELSIRRLSLMRDDARSAARELALTLGSVLEAMDEVPNRAAQPGQTPSLEAVARELRREVAAELERMAQAMRLIADRAGAQTRMPDESPQAPLTIRVRDTQPARRMEDHSPLAPGMPMS